MPDDMGIDGVPSPYVSAYLRRPSQTLPQCCRASGRDEHGQRCPDCSLKPLCYHQESHTGD